MKYAIAATLTALAMFGAGCGESFTNVSPNQVLVQDSDGAVDLNNIARACGGAVNVDKWQKGHGDEAAVVVTCKGGK